MIDPNEVEGYSQSTSSLWVIIFAGAFAALIFTIVLAEIIGVDVEKIGTQVYAAVNALCTSISGQWACDGFPKQ